MKRIIIFLGLCILFMEKSFAEENTLTLCYKYNEEGIEGVEVEIYKVANIITADNKVYMDVLDASIDYNKLINENSDILMNNPKIITDLKNSSLIGITNQAGEINFKALEDGLYLVKHVNSYGEAKDYEYFDKYLINVPYSEDGKLIRNVYCNAKSTTSKLTNDVPDYPETGDSFRILEYLIILIISVFIYLSISEKKNAK